MRYGRLGSLRHDVGMPSCQQRNCGALSALDGNGGGTPRALPWAVMWRPFRPALCGVILDEESHGFSVDGTAQGLRYGRLGSLRYKGLPWFCRFHCEISGLGRVFEMVLGGTGHWPVPSGDSPDGTERRIFLAPARLSNPTRLAIPVGGSPTGTGGSPVPPILKTRTNINPGS